MYHFGGALGWFKTSESGFQDLVQPLFDFFMLNELTAVGCGDAGLDAFKEVSFIRDWSLRFLERANGSLVCHGWKVTQKIVKSLTAFQVVEQRLERNACPAEHGSASEHVGIARYDIV
jgi:hypothetical protein